MISRKDFLTRAGAAALAAPITVQGASIGVCGRARGLMGGAFMGVMLSQQSGEIDWQGKTAIELTVSASGAEASLTASPSSTLIDWGDGTTGTVRTHSYAEPGTYIVTIGREATSWGFATAETKAMATGLLAVGERFSTVGSWFSGSTALTHVGNLTGCTGVANNAFKDCTSLAVIGDTSTLVTIGSNAFCKCPLTNMNLSFDSLTTIAYQGGSGSGCFRDCECRSFHLPKLQTFSIEGFRGCVNITTLSLPACTEIGYEDFRGCSSLTRITDLDKVVTISGWYSIATLPRLTYIGKFSSLQSWGLDSLSGAGSNDNPKDSDGISLVVDMGTHTIDDCLSFNKAWPYGLHTGREYYKFVCVDGWLWRKTVSGTRRTVLNYTGGRNAFPAVGRESYWYRDVVANQYYTWDATTETYAAV